MSAPIHLDGPYRARRSRVARLRRALARFAVRQWLGAWIELAVLAAAAVAMVAGATFVAGLISAYLPTL